MSEKILDNLDLYSDLLMSIGTHSTDRPFMPIETSDLLKQLQEETGDTLEQLSKRVGLGKKRKTTTVNKKTDTSQLRDFFNLQKLSRKIAYTVGWGQSKDGKVGMTIAYNATRLPDPNDQAILLNNVISSAETKKPIIKEDAIDIIDRKIKSPEIPITDIIEHVKSIKPRTEVHYTIGITPENTFLKKCNEQSKQQKITPSELIQKFLQRKYKKNEIKSAILSKNNIIWISLDDEQFHSLENEWKSRKIPVTVFFNQILMEEIEK